MIEPMSSGSSVQGDLSRLLAYGEPGCLYVADIGEYDAAQRDDAQVFERREEGVDAFLFEPRGSAAAENPREKATNPYRPGGHSACRSRILIRCSTRWRGVSTWPYIIVADVGSPSRWAVRMTDSQRSASGFPGDMAAARRYRESRPRLPGSESRPASISRRSVVSSSSELMRAMWATSGAPRACSFSVG